MGVEVERNTELLSFENSENGIHAWLSKEGIQENCHSLFLQVVTERILQ